MSQRQNQRRAQMKWVPVHRIVDDFFDRQILPNDPQLDRLIKAIEVSQAVDGFWRKETPEGKEHQKHWSRHGSDQCDVHKCFSDIEKEFFRRIVELLKTKYQIIISQDDVFKRVLVPWCNNQKEQTRFALL